MFEVSENVKCLVPSNQVFPTYVADDPFERPIRGMALVGTSCLVTNRSLSWQHFSFNFRHVQLLVFDRSCTNQVSLLLVFFIL